MNQSDPSFKGVETVINSVMGVKGADTLNESSSSISSLEFDPKALLTYLGGTTVQIILMILVLWAVTQADAQLTRLPVPSWCSMAIAIVFFTLLSIRSRLFSPLDNTRTKARYTQVVRPTWAPPPLAFPVIWMTIGVLRVIASVLVWLAVGQDFLAVPFIVFVIHLALGDTWNTIFTVEGRLGAAVPVVIVGPLLSAAIVTILYGQTVPLAGWLLAPSVAWIAVACVLVYSIWQLNGCEPLYPLKRENVTKAQ